MKGKLFGFGSFFCPLYILLMIITLMAMPLFVDMEAEIPVPLRPVVVVALILVFLSAIGTWFFIIYDIIHVARNLRFSGRAKAGWICALWFLNIFVIPVYWMKHVRNGHRTTGPTILSNDAPSDSQ